MGGVDLPVSTLGKFSLVGHMATVTYECLSEGVVLQQKKMKSTR
jgi:hypothetical protein